MTEQTALIPADLEFIVWRFSHNYRWRNSIVPTDLTTLSGVRLRVHRGWDFQTVQDGMLPRFTGELHLSAQHRATGTASAITLRPGWDESHLRYYLAYLYRQVLQFGFFSGGPPCPSLATIT